ncbi:MAG: glycosyltransferase [Actinomycetota bacterium]
MTISTLISHEWIAPTGGSENVFYEMLQVVPDAVAVTLWNDDLQRFPTVHETWLAHTPLRRHKAMALPFMSATWKARDLTGVDRVVVSSHAFGHHLASKAAQMNKAAYAYIHSPARYLWAPTLDTRGGGSATRHLRELLTRYDRAQVNTNVRYAANSNYIAQRIADAWDVEADVIYPPVSLGPRTGTLSDADQTLLEKLPSEFVLGASRLVSYKRLDAAISVGEMLGMPVVLAGSGPDRERLQHLARKARVPVHFAGRVSDDVLWQLYDRANLFVFVGIEDFGIMPVEAVSCGTPVVVNETGGAAESVRLLHGGVSVDPRSQEALKDAAMTAMGLDMSYAVNHVNCFSSGAFHARLGAWLSDPGTRNASVES